MAFHFCPTTHPYCLFAARLYAFSGGYGIIAMSGQELVLK
jgi:hypothetical protein